MSKFKTVCGVIAFVLFFLMLGAVGAIEQDIVPLFPGMVRVFALMALWVLFCNLAGAFDYHAALQQFKKNSLHNVLRFLRRAEITESNTIHHIRITVKKLQHGFLLHRRTPFRFLLRPHIYNKSADRICTKIFKKIIAHKTVYNLQTGSCLCTPPLWIAP